MTKARYSIPKNVQQTVIALLTAESADLRVLAQIAGRDPATFYRGANLRSCDLSKDNLEGIDLTGAERGRSKLPPSIVRRYWAKGEATPLETAIQLKRTMDQLAPHLPPETGFALQLAFIKDLMRREDHASIELLAPEVLRIVKDARPSEISEIRSVWARFIFHPSNITIGDRSNFERKWKLMQPELLESLQLESSLGNVIIGFIREIDGLPNSVSSNEIKLTRFSLKRLALESAARETISSGLIRSAGATTSFEVIHEIARSLSIMRRPSIQVWRRTIQEAPTLVDAHAVFQEMIRENVTPKIDEWNSLIRKAGKLFERRRILSSMLEADVEPNSMTCSLLLEVAPSFPVGVKLLEILINSGAPFIDCSPLARLIKTTKDASEFFELVGEYRAPETYSISVILERLAATQSGRKLINWALFDLPEYGVRSIPEDFGSSINVYIRSNRLQDALSIAMIFPEIPESTEIFRDHGSRSFSLEFFHKELKGKLPYFPAAALAFLYHAIDHHEDALHWVRFAMRYRKQAGQRYEPLASLSDQLRGG